MVDLDSVFGDWMKVLDRDMMEKYRRMLMQTTLNGISICPDGGRVFHAFRACDFNNLKVVVLGQDPYFDGNATGLAFANDIFKEGFEDLSPSLKVIRDSVLSLVDSEEMPIFDPSLESWAEQGILLLNSALTVRTNHPGSHLEAWKPFIQKVLTGISAETNCCFLCLVK